MKNILIVYSAIVFLFSCTSEPQNKHLTYQNIIILSDLSSRIDNKAPKDIEEIHKIVQYFKNECVKPGEKIGDKSSIYFSSFSDKFIATIDIDKIKNLGEKQQFINSTGKFQNSGLAYQIDDFEQKVKNAYANIRNKGLDLISILIEKIENEPIVKKDIYLTDGIDTTFIKYDNHIYIFTDGYLEYLNKSTNNQFYFSSPEIDEIRQYCKVNNVNIPTALDTNYSLCLTPIKNKKNQFINLHILETHERDKNDKLQTYKYPLGQRDNEILEAVWRKWATESGFKSFEWKKY
ncbi:hypothetical protein [Runella slithyformis]|uniref:Uncharacterized protein n=1 Tax=Runella slithyformis (strain ATCC 29530 / DSM 19594 / LMG 11500 / NCIMB 11436 / LSU 4) TaxID=761193 RepID=A0A7U4E6G3_RUNSL|nr:hypothetical protein [Runella slithyformis]AEI49228.1 hypothetical protein Runsl_2839 [Runella slithyformis DSM 19594]